MIVLGELLGAGVVVAPEVVEDLVQSGVLGDGKAGPEVVSPIGKYFLSWGFTNPSEDKIAPSVFSPALLNNGF